MFARRSFAVPVIVNLIFYASSACRAVTWRMLSSSFDFENIQNWSLRRLPCINDTVSYRKQYEGYIITNLIKSLNTNNPNFNSSNGNSECGEIGSLNVFQPKNASDWFNPDYWQKIPRLTKRESANNHTRSSKSLFDARNIPCPTHKVLTKNAELQPDSAAYQHEVHGMNAMERGDGNLTSYKSAYDELIADTCGNDALPMMNEICKNVKCDANIGTKCFEPGKSDGKCCEFCGSLLQVMFQRALITKEDYERVLKIVSNVFSKYGSGKIIYDTMITIGGVLEIIIVPQQDFAGLNKTLSDELNAIVFELEVQITEFSDIVLAVKTSSYAKPEDSFRFEPYGEESGLGAKSGGSKSGLSVGQKIGLGLGIPFAIISVLLAGLFYLRWRKRQGSAQFHQENEALSLPSF